MVTQGLSNSGKKRRGMRWGRYKAAEDARFPLVARQHPSNWAMLLFVSTTERVRGK